MRTKGLALSLAMAALTPAFAATSPPAQTLPEFGTVREVAPPSAAPAPSQEPTADRALVALAERHFEVLNLQDRLAELMAERFTAVVDSQVAALGASAGEAAAAAMKSAAAEALDAALAAKGQEWKAAVVAVIARTYTAEELTALNRFYDGEVGRSIAAKSSVFAAALRQTAPTMVPGSLADDIMARYCAKLECRP